MIDNEWVSVMVSDISSAFAKGQVEDAHKLIEEVLAKINRGGVPAFYAEFAIIAEHTHSIRAFEDYMDLKEIEYKPESSEGPMSDAPEDPESDDGGETFSNVGEDPTGDDSGVEL